MSSELKQLVREMKVMQSDLKQIKTVVNEIDQFQHKNVNPSYLKKLKKIQLQKGKTYNSIHDLDKDLE